MPEGPEVSYLVNKHLISCIGKELNKIKILSGRYKNHGPPKNYNKFIKLLPLKCIDVFKKGKVIFFKFENNWCIISKLGLSGWWYNENYKIGWKNHSYKTIIFNWNNHGSFKPRRLECSLSSEDRQCNSSNQSIIYSDFRNFGTMIFTNDNIIINHEINKLAPDILDPKLKFKDIEKNIILVTKKYKDKLIEDIIIDQRLILSGIGNYLKSEILYQAKISPLRKLSKITLDEWRNIFTIAKNISKKMTKLLNNEDFTKYVNAMKIYHKKLDSLNNIIKTHKTKSGRTTFWVPKIQT
jgi:formamidopyrimidine-DNA glycosylase